ncbi:MAG: DNA translocase FtsK 4TM domain-containing protein [Janthinobacterium lividum]
MKSQRLVYAPTRSRRLNEVFGLAVIAAACLLLLALLTYNPGDPSFDTVAGGVNPAHPAHNWTGLVGAYFADLTLQTLGVAALLVPFAVGRVGVSWLRSRKVGAGVVKAAGVLLWLVFAPAGIALLPLHWSWKGALPLAGVEGRVLADGLVHLLNAPGAAILTVLMMALSLYLATSFAMVTAPQWVSGHFAFLRSGHQQIARWRQRRGQAEATDDAPAAVRDRDHLEEEPEQDMVAERAPNSLLSGLLRFFTRKKSAEANAAEAVGETADEQASPWRGMPRTHVDALELSGLAAASAAAAPFAAQLAAAAAPIRPAEPEIDAGLEQHAAEADFSSAPRIEFASGVDDGWLDAPERQPVKPLSPQDSAATAAGPHLVRRGATMPVPEPSPYPIPSPFPDPAPMPDPTPVTPVSASPAMRERPVPPRATPQPAPQNAAPVQPRPMPPQAPSPSPMADIRDQNIAFGARADAHIDRLELRPKSIKGYKLPPSTLLHQSEGQTIVREDALRAEAQVLVEKCAEFGVAGRVEQINPGPVVTTFEFRPDAGVKYSRVTGLADDLCLAMAAESILIERMAGKSTVGIQVPNTERETIWLRDVVESESFAATKSKLPIALGKDIDGRIVTADLASMPHVLIAGSTGSGKSVAINAMIMSVLFRATPEQVRLILVDPKRVELGMYEGIPHLFTPIITEAKLAANALKNAVREMERRLKLLAANHVRNLDQFNALFASGSEYIFEDVNQEPLPYIIIVIDELADLMMLDRANVEEAITRLAQMARAVGIHLVLATQRPSVDVITGLLKANVPTRMSFRLATKIDSRTIIDTNGAESLLGRGDMLFLPPGTSRLQRVHAPFVTEKEIAAVTGFWKAQGEAEYVEGFLDGPKDEKSDDGSGSANQGEDADPMFDDAVRLVFEFGKASTSLLQRRLRIGYGRAAHLIDTMERDGLVGPADGSKPRELLKPASYFSEVDAAIH